MRTDALAGILLLAGLICSITSILTISRLGNDPSGSRRIGGDTLIVGGTDGSGTRSVADLLEELGVPITTDSPETLDTDAREMMGGGWPPTVRLIMNATRRADYQVSDLPKDAMKDAVLSVSKYWSSWRSRPGIRNLTPVVKGQSSIAWAFKAPVSMLLLPIFLEVARRNNYGKVKFLHVVRDGRDISYSGNQSPVKKFYNISFPVGSNGALTGAAESLLTQQKKWKRLQAINLWSTWNTQLYDWERRTARSSSEQFDFLVLHIEDLVSSDVETRRAAIASVSKFVGSSIGDVGICCLANQGKMDLGSHTEKKIVKMEREPVESRYGKWKLLASPDEISTLNEVGMEGLNAFGYEPYERPTEQMNPSIDGSCNFDACKSWTAPRGFLTRLRRKRLGRNHRKARPIEERDALGMKLGVENIRERENRRRRNRNKLRIPGA